MDPIWLKILLSCTGSLVIILVGWLKHMSDKLNTIVPKNDIHEMIKIALEPGLVRTQSIKEHLLRIEEQLDFLTEMLINGSKRSR